MAKLKSWDDLKRFREESQTETSLLKPESEKTILAVGEATCGIAAGAKKVADALRDEINRQGIQNVSVVTTGCLGYCYAEPMVEVRMPGKGEHLASFGPVHLFAARIEMPNAAGPAAGARAVIGSAAELTKAEPGALEDLFLVGDSGAADLHWAETNGDATPYLLVITESGCALMPCGENEGEARRFARQVAAAAATADAMREARRARLAEATDTVRHSEQDLSEIQAAQANRASTEQDPELLQAIERARDRLSFEREETTEIDQTGAVLQGVLDRLTTAPKPLPRGDPR